MTEELATRRTRRVDEALADYLDARQRGVPLERHAFLAQHADIVGELQSLLDDCDRLERLLKPAAASGGVGGDSTIGCDAPPAALAPLPRRFGDFELLEEIARGGMGVVYKARQTSLHRIVAVKMILDGRLASKADIDRFYAEAKAAAMLDHPDITPVFEFGEVAGQHFFSMGYVEGQSLAARVAAGPLPAREAALILHTVAVAVHYAHQHGIVHRDLKPGNILIDAQGKARITDFGLAKRESDASGLTLSGQLLGTPSFMPPEQVSGRHDCVGPPSDVYSMGATLYALLTARPPFQAACTIDILKQVLDGEPVPPRQLDRAIPRDLEVIVLKCLQKAPSQRYLTAQALAEDLRRFLADEPIVARRPTQWYRAKKFVRRNKLAVAAALAVMAALVGGMVIASVGYVQARRQAEIARTKAAQRQQVILFLKDTLLAVGLPAEGELANLDQLFDDATLLAATNKVESARLLRLRGTLRARIGRWQEATADFLQANRLALDGGEWSFDSATLLLRAGRPDDYRRVCHAYLAQAAQTPSCVSADMAAKASLLLPVAGADFELACRLADFAAGQSTPDWHVPCIHLGKALAEYRQARYDSAVQWAERAIGSQKITPRQRAAAYFIKACAYGVQGQGAPAREAFQQGESALSEPFNAFTGVFGDTWCDRTIAEHVRQEATRRLADLSGGASAGGDASAKDSSGSRE
ncbi:MAG: serine/threonine protein kinase [Pirellulales bacterium]|nr:serine/threonine protein kinase [Pirellulales bacterium]